MRNLVQNRTKHDSTFALTVYEIVYNSRRLFSIYPYHTITPLYQFLRRINRNFAVIKIVVVWFMWEKAWRDTLCRSEKLRGPQTDPVPIQTVNILLKSDFFPGVTWDVVSLHAKTQLASTSFCGIVPGVAAWLGGHVAMRDSRYILPIN